MQCRFDECDRADLIQGGPHPGYCKGHWQQLKRGAGLAPLRQVRRHGACRERDALGRKHCILCDEWLEVMEFQPNKQSLDGLNPRCLLCASLAKHSLTKLQYRELLASQGGVCAICLRDPDSGRFVVDHDHACCPGTNSCGQCVRGICCRRCNMTLGYALDNPATLRSAAEYLERAMVMA